MAIHFSILVWKIPWQRSLAGPWGLKRIRHDLVTKQQRKCREELNRAKKYIYILTEIKNAQEEVSSKLDDTKEQINELKEYWKSLKLKSKKNF